VRRFAAEGAKVAYALSKSALQGLARGLARDFGPRGITVNVVQPGPIDTDANPADGPMTDLLHSFMAIKRHGRPDEVAGMVAWLAQSKSAAQQAYGAWEMVMKSQHAMLESMRGAGAPFQIAADQYKQLLAFQSQQYKAALEYMDKMAKDFQQQIDQRKK
jgi:short-subunit dehydrogenase